ncbi:MAG: tRNA1(Val) (adenine(37)-N6)-methyltransferase [Bacteroidales bacterium]
MKTRKNKLSEKRELFRFKEFSLSDRQSAMKIGTDGVLLGAFASGFQAKRVLDIGTGCGLISLMIAQKCMAEIDAVEIEKEAAKEALQNFSDSPWPHLFKVYNKPVQEFYPPDNITYDLIVSNPPFFENCIKSLDQNRIRARHTETLSFDELFFHSQRLMDAKGKLIVIFPYIALDVNDEKASENDLFPYERLIIKPTSAHPPGRIITIYSKNYVKEVKEKNLCIETEKRHKFTKKYINLTREFHPFL